MDDENGTTLFAAAVEEHVDVVSYLIKHGANVNARSNKQSTPLITASFCNNKNVVKCLIQHGANVDPRDETGFTAVHYALLGQEERGR